MEISDYKNRELWYALLLSIVKRMSAEETLQIMGL